MQSLFYVAMCGPSPYDFSLLRCAVFSIYIQFSGRSLALPCPNESLVMLCCAIISLYDQLVERILALTAHIFSLFMLCVMFSLCLHFLPLTNFFRHYLHRRGSDPFPCTVSFKMCLLIFTVEDCPLVLSDKRDPDTRARSYKKKNRS